MDLGILPKVSTVASPFAAREMAQASRTGKEKTDLTPMLKFLAAIPNFILQVVCDQPDMEFAFEGMREVQDEAAITDMLVKQSQIGVRSVDEFRDKIGLPAVGPARVVRPAGVHADGPDPAVRRRAIASRHGAGQARHCPPGLVIGGGKKPAASAKPLPSRHGSRPPACTGRRGAHPGACGVRRVHARTAPARRSRTRPRAPPGVGEGCSRRTGGPDPASAEGPGDPTWEPRNLPPRALALIAENIAKGMDAAAGRGDREDGRAAAGVAISGWRKRSRRRQAQAQQQATDRSSTSAGSGRVRDRGGRQRGKLIAGVGARERSRSPRLSWRA